MSDNTPTAASENPTATTGGVSAADDAATVTVTANSVSATADAVAAKASNISTESASTAEANSVPAMHKNTTAKKSVCAVSLITAAPLLAESATLADDSPLSDNSLPGGLCERLSEQRRRKYLSLASPRDRALSLAASLALDAVLETVGLRERDGVVTYTELGAPTLTGHYVSLSHSGVLAGAVLADEPCGLDIEQPRGMPRERLLSLASRFFSPPDAAAVESADNTESEFYRIWTRREAFMKLLGRGFTVPMDSFYSEGGHIRCGDEIYPVRTYLCGDYRISLCIRSGTLPEQLPEPTDPTATPRTATD